MAKSKTLNILEDSIYEEIADLIDLLTASPTEIAEKFKELFESSKDECQESSLQIYRSSAPKILAQMRKVSRGFEKRNFERWKPAFDHLELMVEIASDLGEMHGQDVKASDGESNNIVMAALANLYPRVLLVTREIICLLKGGFPDGALGRWRTLHEISVTMMYLVKHGEASAKAYLLSFHFASRRAALQLNEHFERANFTKFSDVELKDFDLRCEMASEALGRAIANDKDGEWPAIYKHRNFADVEKDVGMDHWRPRYKWASIQNHANHRPNDKMLGMVESQHDFHLVGPSNSGFVDPFQMTAISLAQATTTYLLHVPNADRIIHSSVLLRLAEEMSIIARNVEASSKAAYDRQKTR